ncbi:MAG TPA: hypothetical protein VMX17_10395 [Candidatus Glassbacteria bacterium]|nr:hypothetical protein [Candidatus Glassbacteria bacterium]
MICFGIGGTIYLIIAFIVFIWRYKNMIRFQEGEFLISMVNGSFPAWYAALNVLRKTIEIDGKLTKAGIQSWNEAILHLEMYWKTILIEIAIKSLLFPITFLVGALIFATKKWNGFIDSYTFSPFKGFKLEHKEDRLGESDSYRLPCKIINHSTQDNTENNDG